MHVESNNKQVEILCILICACNEEAHITEVVRSALAQNPACVIVVDDGSTDRTAELAETAGAHVLSNAENQGKGAALQRGFEWVYGKDFDAVIVLDGDGQHNPVEIPRFLDTYERTGIPVLIGNRMADTSRMSSGSRTTVRLLAWLLNRLTRIYVPDPPCGYRFYRTDILPFIMSTECRFACEFDILIHAALRRIRVGSVRISTIPRKRRFRRCYPIRDIIHLTRTILEHFPASRYDPQLKAD